MKHEQRLTSLQFKESIFQLQPLLYWIGSQPILVFSFSFFAQGKKKFHVTNSFPQELEERERNLNNMNSRSEMAFQTLQRECRHQEERAKDLEHRVSRLELECNAEEQQKEMAQKTMADFLRRLSNALGIEGAESHSNDALIDRVSDLVQDHTKTRIKSSSLSDSLATVEIELRESRNALNRALMDKENLQRQAASHLIELERLRKVSIFEILYLVSAPIRY